MRFLLLSVFFIISCGKGGSKESAFSNETQDVTCNTLGAKVIIDDLDWYDFSNARNYEEYQNSRTVGKVTIPKARSRCTGFIINENTIMTNNHCISNANQALGVTFSIRDRGQDVKAFKCEKYIGTNQLLDYTLVQCDRPLGLEFGINSLSDESLSVDDEVYVIQENCDYTTNSYCEINKFIAIGDIAKVGKYIIDHNADTLGGSSGSPIYSSKTNKVVAIHNAGSLSVKSNYGVPMKEIIKDIKSRFSDIKLYTNKVKPTPSQSCE